MIEHMLMLMSGFHLFFQLEVFISIIIGGLIGIIMGALPGMTVVMAISLALPFTFYLSPVTAIAFLLSIYKGGIYGGSISAILIGTPGTPSAAATALDGYALSKKGMAKKALDTALYSSVISDILSDIITIIVTVQIAFLALRIGPAEFFTIIVFSLTVIAAVSGESLVKGLIAGSLGLLLATVGLDTMFHTPRFTFGLINLRGGLHLIPVLVGIFAIPEILSQLKAKKLNPEMKGIDEGSATSLSPSSQDSISFAEFKGLIRTIVEGSLIGTVIGVIPGLGSAPAAFASYSRAKNRAKNPKEFGQGSLLGIAAAESGNNGTCGPALIPLLSLGIPGSTSMALLLAALMIQGLRPGPMLFRERMDIVSGIFISMVIINLVILGLGKIIIRWAALTIRIPKEILFTTVFVLCVFGSYAVNNNLFDVWVLVIMGGVGFLFKTFKIPLAPFVIAFILSPLLENGLRRALIAFEGNIFVLFTRPISLTFLLLTFMVIVFLVRGSRKRRREALPS